MSLSVQEIRCRINTLAEAKEDRRRMDEGIDCTNTLIESLCEWFPELARLEVISIVEENNGAASTCVDMCSSVAAAIKSLNKAESRQKTSDPPEASLPPSITGNLSEHVLELLHEFKSGNIIAEICASAANVSMFLELFDTISACACFCYEDEGQMVENRDRLERTVLDRFLHYNFDKEAAAWDLLEGPLFTEPYCATTDPSNGSKTKKRNKKKRKDQATGNVVTIAKLGTGSYRKTSPYKRALEEEKLAAGNFPPQLPPQRQGSTRQQLHYQQQQKKEQCEAFRRLNPGLDVHVCPKSGQLAFLGLVPRNHNTQPASFASFSSSSSSPPSVSMDLHHMTVRSALELLHSCLALLVKPHTAHKLLSGCGAAAAGGGSSTSVQILLLVGRGLHSPGGHSILRRAIEQYISRLGLPLSHQDGGTILSITMALG